MFKKKALLKKSGAVLAVAALGSLLVGMPLYAGSAPEEPSIDLNELSLEELKQVMIVSVSKKPEKLSEAAAAISVITAEDIRRSTAITIPDLLRGVPGLQVGQINANTWAVGSRGFNHRYANKLLVLIDGRSVYTPMFSGVYWHVQDMLLEDIERIEVIRGPGATLWGANAVNGVINIITKHTADTQGGLLTAGTGNEEQGFGGFRYGFRLGRKAYGRAYLKYSKRDDFRDAYSRHGEDDWDTLKGGFRFDWEGPGQDVFTFQGDIYNGDAGERMGRLAALSEYLDITRYDQDFSGGNLLFRWQHTFSDTADTTLQVYYDRTRMHNSFSIGPRSRYTERFDTFDIDFQHRFQLGTRHALVWGVGCRIVRDHFSDTNSPIFTFDPGSRTNRLFSAFFQDDITLIPGRLRLVLGTKVEHNDYTGFEVQPSARLLWKLGDRQVIWAAVSRAVRTPSRYEHDSQSMSIGVVPLGLPTLLSVEGNRHVDSENLRACELGYRLQVTPALFLDLALFYNVYSDFRSVEPGRFFFASRPQPAHFVFALDVDNGLDARTYGLEVSVDWDPKPWLRLQAAYTYLDIEMHNDRNTFYAFGNPPEDSNPHNQFSLNASVDLRWNLEWDIGLRYVDDLGDFVDSYLEMDMRLAWSPVRDFEIALIGRNLFDDHHPEFVVSRPGGFGEVERSIFGKILWRF